MSEWLNDGKILYFLIWFDVNGVRKFAYIPWCGEGVTGMRKGLFNNHANDVSFLFKGFHAQFNARNEKDLKEAIIMEKLRKSTGANYDSGSKNQGSAKAVPQSVAQGRQQATVSNAKVRTFEKYAGATDQSTENRPESSTIKYDSRAIDQSTESKPIASTLQGTGAGPGQAPAQGNARNVRAQFEQGRGAPPQSNPPPSNRMPPAKMAPAAAPPMSKPPPSTPPPPVPKPKEPEPIPEPEPVEEYIPEPEPEPVYEPEPMPEPEPPVQESYEPEPYQEEPQEPYQEEQVSEYQEDQYAAQGQGHEENYPQEETGGGAAAGGIGAKALYDYDAENPDDLSFKEGEFINVLDQSDPSGWWEGELNGKRGFFPSNFVELS